MNQKKAKRIRRALREQLGVDRIAGHPAGYLARAIKGWLVNRGERMRPPLINLQTGEVATDYATRINKFRAHVHPESSRAAYHRAKAGLWEVIS